MFEGKLRITPIHPFTGRQAQIIVLRANGASCKEVANKLGITVATVKQHISGNRIGDGSKSDKGILGIIEEIRGERPVAKGWVSPLVGDVLLFERRKTISGVVKKQ